eukprot:5879375-Prorocentrum_lima.AAC.1
MTSSLVGSEMCIRDSNRAADSGWTWEAVPPIDSSKKARWSDWSVDSSGSVSYTHLTLPTICSV